MRDFPRLYAGRGAQQTALQAGQSYVPAPGQAHYLVNVMRCRVGDGVVLFNAHSGEWQGHISAITRKEVSITLEHQTRAPRPEPGPTLFFAPLKRDATDTVIRMGTELGAGAFVPVRTERTNTAKINPERLQHIAEEAAEQSERLSCPEIGEMISFAQLMALPCWQNRTLAAALERYEASTDPAPATGQVDLLIGPEGGFSELERSLLARAAHVRPLSLGPRILRADTASAAGLAYIIRQYY